MITVTLSDKEHALILAALKLYERMFHGPYDTPSDPFEIQNIVRNEGRLKAPTENDLAVLCQKLKRWPIAATSSRLPSAMSTNRSLDCAPQSKLRMRQADVQDRIRICVVRPGG
jgi:hypothetical protein